MKKQFEILIHFDVESNNPFKAKVADFSTYYLKNYTMFDNESDCLAFIKEMLLDAIQDIDTRISNGTDK